jgi:hypothetical protein
MKRFTCSLICAVALAMASFGLTASVARASDCPPQYRYEWVLRYETRQVPYTVCETRYDHCGQAYHVNVTRYRTERVGVWHRVAVRY